MTLSIPCAICLRKQPDMVYANGCVSHAQHHICVACALQYTSSRILAYQQEIQQLQSIVAATFQCTCPVCRLPTDAWFPAPSKKLRLKTVSACAQLNSAIVHDIISIFLDKARSMAMAIQDDDTEIGCRALWASLAPSFPRLSKLLGEASPPVDVFFTRLAAEVVVVIADSADAVTQAKTLETSAQTLTKVLHELLLS